MAEGDGDGFSSALKRVLEDETLLFGEHLSRSHFEDVPELRPYAGLADVLAEHAWPRLYEEDNAAACEFALHVLGETLALAHPLALSRVAVELTRHRKTSEAKSANSERRRDAMSCSLSVGCEHELGRRCARLRSVDGA